MRPMPVAAIVAVLSVIVVPAACRRLRTRSPLPSRSGRSTARATTSRTPTWGRRERPYLRLAPAAYADGVGHAGQPARPPATSATGSSTTARRTSSPRTRVTQWGFVWGQFLDHTFGLREEAGGEPRADRLRPHRPAGGVPQRLRRDRRSPARPPRPEPASAGSPREQINTVSSYIDGSAVYSDSDAAARVAARRREAASSTPRGCCPRRGAATSRPRPRWRSRAGSPASPRRRWSPATCARTRTSR